LLDEFTDAASGLQGYGNPLNQTSQGEVLRPLNLETQTHWPQTNAVSEVDAPGTQCLARHPANDARCRSSKLPATHRAHDRRCRLPNRGITRTPDDSKGVKQKIT